MSGLMNFVAVLCVMGMIRGNSAWLKPSDLEDLFSIFKPKEMVPQKIAEEPKKRPPNDMIPIVIDLTPNEMGFLPRDGIPGSNDKDLEVLLDMADSLNPMPLNKRAKPNEKLLMSISEMFVPFQPDAKGINFPDLFERNEFPRGLGEFGFPLGDMQFHHRHPAKKDAKRRMVHKRHTFKFMKELPKSSPTTYQTHNFMNLSGSPELYHINHIPRELDQITEKNKLNDTEVFEIQPEIEVENMDVSSENSVCENQNRNRRFDLYAAYWNIGVLTVIVPFFGGLLVTVMAVELMRRNKCSAGKKFLPYNPAEEC